MGTGLFSVSRGIAGTLSVALTASLLEQQRAVHAIELAQQQGLLTLPAEWAMTQLHQIFTDLGDTAGIAQVKAAAQFHTMMLAEASVSAYQDIFMLSGFISLFNILPAFLRSRKTPPPTAAPTPGPASVTERAGATPRNS
jgi:hypothetical protein